MTAQSTSLISGWKRGTPGATSTTSFQDLPYTDATTATLASSALTQAGGWVYVGFNLKINTEPGFDFVNVDWSTDGTNWNAAKWVWEPSSSTWRNDLTFTGKNAAYPAFNAERVAFQAPAGTVYVRFRLASDELVSAPLYEGASVDDVTIKG